MHFIEFYTRKILELKYLNIDNNNNNFLSFIIMQQIKLFKLFIFN